MTSRELVLSTLEFRNDTGRVPRQIWTLPWTYDHFPKELAQTQQQFPDDIVNCPNLLKKPAPTKGNPFVVGQYIDEWGCEFENRQQGIIGEVKTPMIIGEEWEDADKIREPVELLNLDVDGINAFCAGTDQFVNAITSARIFERLQFLAGTEKTLMDLLLQPDGMLEAMEKIHKFFCKELEAWAKTDVDAIVMQDDWGSQRSLMISPKLWEELFKPLYADYVAIAKKHGKKFFLHSDGYIVDIIPHLIDIGVDALNSQIFVMGVEKLAPFKGQITFWGEIDRQYLLSRGTSEEVRQGVRKVHDLLWHNGGCIGQVEFGPGSNPANLVAALDEWDQYGK